MKHVNAMFQRTVKTMVQGKIQGVEEKKCFSSNFYYYFCGFLAFKSPPIENALRTFKSPCVCVDGRIATTFRKSSIRKKGVY